MRKAAYLTLIAVAVASAAAQAQSVRSSPDVFPIAPAPMHLPVAPAPQPPVTNEVRPISQPAPLAEANSPPVLSWEIKVTDVRLDRVMDRWAQTAGWRVQWDANRHVELAGPNTFHGSFQEVVGQVLSTPGIRMSDYPLEGCIYPNTPPLVRITRMGDQINECPEEYKQ